MVFDFFAGAGCLPASNIFQLRPPGDWVALVGLLLSSDQPPFQKKVGGRSD
jgi:hypothetical protein